MPIATSIDDSSAETRRLAGLHELMVLDSAPEPLFDSIVQMASDICGTPIALLSLVDQQRQWFKANVGLPGIHEMPRSVSFCAQAIGEDGVLEVPDATQDARFAENPLVTGTLAIRFYAGAPLVLPRGERIGTLCVIDHKARSLTAAQQDKLQALATMASQALVMRQQLIQKSLAVRSTYEDALARSETKYRALVEEQSELISLAEADGTLTFMNAAYARHFGFRPDQMTGKNLFDFVARPDQAAVRTRIAAVLSDGVTRTSENRMQSADGAQRWLEWTNRLRFDEQGKQVLHSVGRDVTERKQAEQALRTSQSFLQRTNRIAGVGGWEIDLDDGTVVWSEETRRIHEVADDFMPMVETGIEFYAPSARPSIEAAVKKALDDGTPWDLELPFVTATGRNIWVRTVGELETENGRPSRLIGAFQDITERKWLEQRVINSEHFTRYVTDNVPVRLSYVDHQCRYRFVNRTHCEGLGLARDEIVGRTRSELLQGLDEALIAQRVDAALAGQPQQFEFEEVVAGGRRLIEAQLLPDVAADGDVRGYFSIGVDVTERANAEHALRELTAIIENTTDYVMQADHQGHVNYMNPAVRQVLGLAPDAPVAHLHFSDFNTPQTNQAFNDVIVPTVRAGKVWIGNTKVYAEDRHEIPVSHMVIAHRDGQGRIARFSSVMRNISAAVEAEAEARRQTAILRSVAEAIPSSVAVLDAEGRYQFVNRTFEQWCGLSREQILDRRPAAVLGEHEFERRRPWIERVKSGEPVSFELDYPGQRPAHQLISYLPLHMETGDATAGGYVVVAQDVTQQRLEQRRLLELSQRDALTGLLNRPGFEDSMRRQLQMHDAAMSLAVLYIDLDHFKPVNDQHGHPTGDRVLQLFAKRLENVVRPTDVLARLGGDEFAIGLFGVGKVTNAHGVADKVLRAAKAPFRLGALLLQLDASVGVAFASGAEIDLSRLVEQADAQLLKAKAAGKGRHA